MKKRTAVNPPIRPSWLADLLRDKGLWHNLLGALIGSGLAFGGAFTIFYIQEVRHAHQEQTLKREREKILLEGFERAFEGNSKILLLIVADQKHSPVSVNNLNLTFFESTAQMKYQELTNVGLAKKIDEVVFRLNSLEISIKNYQNIYFNPLSTGTKFLQTRGEILRKEIILNAVDTLKTIRPVMGEIKDELERFK